MTDAIRTPQPGTGLAVALCVATALWSLAVPAPAAASGAFPDRDRLLGDPDGARTGLERLGVTLQLFYHQLIGGELAGGTDSEAVFGHSGSYDFFARVDLDALAGWPGGRVLLQAKGQYDRSVNEDVGALRDPIDDADFDAPLYVDQLWLEQALFDARLRLRVGLVEQQTLFDRNAYANSEDRQFLNSSLDNNGIVPLPDGLTAALIAVPLPWLEIAAGAADAENVPRQAGFDTAFDGTDSLNGYVEASFASPFERCDRPGRYRLGGFVDGREKTRFESGRASRGHVGAYLSFDQLLWQAADAPGRQLGAFARAAYADRDVNAAAWFWSAGLEHTGPFPFRPRDVLGLGVYQTLGSSVYRDEVDSRFRRETGIELYYAVRALGWLVLTPDLQVIFDPGATGANDTAVVATLRARVSF